MSRTIITNSGSDFYTNISSEQLLGRLCVLAGAKFFNDKVNNIPFPKLAYSMTEEEATDTADKLEVLKTVLPVFFANFVEYANTVEELLSFVDFYIDAFRKSKGYNCI